MTRPIEKTPQKRDRGESTRRILQAAVEIFAENGFDGATTKPDVDTAQLAALAVEYSFAIGIIKRMCFERSVAECEEASRVFSITMTKGICNN